MDRAERITLLHDLLTRNRFGLSTARLMQECGCARSTLYQALNYMRDALAAPLVHEGDMETQIWRYEKAGYQLPTMWLSANELLTMLLAQQLWQHIKQDKASSGLLGPALGPLEPRVRKIMGNKIDRLERLHIRGVQIRASNDAAFRTVTDGVLEACQLKFEYQARSSDRDRTRRVSPQRLTHYRGNWYLDALEHGSKKLLRFAVERMRGVILLRDQPSTDVSAADLDAHNAGYGIFSGPLQGIAVICFSPFAARWVAEETWHPAQTQQLLPDGSLELRLPFGNPQELLMDVQRFGADAEILEPASLRAQMKERHLQAAARYG